MKRKHYNEIIAWANGAEIEEKQHGVWVKYGKPSWHEDREYRIKPKTIMIGDIGVPEPVLEAPICGQKYWTICFTTLDLAVLYTWNDDYVDHRLLERGLIHMDKESAVLHAKALIKVSGGTL